MESAERAMRTSDAGIADTGAAAMTMAPNKHNVNKRTVFITS